MNEPNYWIPPRGFTIPIGDGFTIYYYAIMIVCGIILATVVVGLLFKRRNIPVEWVLDLLLCVLPVGIVCARLFYCITGGVPFPYWFSLDEEHGIRAGGLSIIGGVMGGVLGVVLFCVIHKINFLRVADCVAPGVILAQGIGRWGNFFNQEVYGRLVENTSLQWFPFAVYIENTNSWHYAFFFYESVLNIIAFALLFTLLWKFRKKPGGLALAGYLFGYGVVRAIMEPLRAPQYILGDSVQVSWVMAIVMAVAGVMLALCLLIFAFSFFYASMQFNPDDISRTIQQNGGFIQGIRPGKPTADYLRKINGRITLFGAIYLTIVALIPSVLAVVLTGVGMSTDLISVFSTTGILSVVSVALELDKQLQSQLMMKNYRGFLK